MDLFNKIVEKYYEKMEQNGQIPQMPNFESSTIKEFKDNVFRVVLRNNYGILYNGIISFNEKRKVSTTSKQMNISVEDFTKNYCTTTKMSKITGFHTSKIRNIISCNNINSIHVKNSTKNQKHSKVYVHTQNFIDFVKSNEYYFNQTSEQFKQNNK